MAVATKKINQSVADQTKVAGANLQRNQTRAARAGRVGYIIHSPTRGKVGPKGEKLWEIGKCILPIHRHNIITKKGENEDEDGRTDDEYYTYEGSVLVGLDGEWFTTDEIQANYVRAEYGPKGYIVDEVNRKQPGQSILDSEAYLEAKAIRDGDYDFDYVEEEHPDTPRIIAE